MSTVGGPAYYSRTGEPLTFEEYSAARVAAAQADRARRPGTSYQDWSG